MGNFGNIDSTLLLGEAKIVSSNDGSFFLSNYRVYQSKKYFGNSYTNSIMLDKISSIEVATKSRPILLILAGILFLFGMYSFLQNNQDEVLVGIIFLSIILFLIYVFTLKQVIIVSPDGGKPLFLRLKNIGASNALGLLKKIEETRINKLDLNTSFSGQNKVENEMESNNLFD